MNVSISNIVAVPTAKLHVPVPVGVPKAEQGLSTKKTVDGLPAEEPVPGRSTDAGSRTSPLASSLTQIRDTVSFGSDQPDDASAGVGRSGSAADADGDVDLLAPGSVVRMAPDDADDPTGIITVGAKTLDLATVDYLPTDSPAARALKLRAAIAAVFGSAAPGAAGSGIAGASAGELLVAVQDLFAAQQGKSDSDLAAERLTTTRERILSDAGAAIDAQTGDLPESVLQLLR